jgi:predicted small metal-binding protein
MKKLRCDESGIGKDCNWEFIGETDEEVLEKAREHDRRMHDAQPDDATLRPYIRSV